MVESIVKETIQRIVKELEDTGDLVVLNEAGNIVVERLYSALQEVSPNFLSPQELGGIINTLNAHRLGFGLDDNDFQTIIGLTKEELALVAEKLQAGNR